MKVIAVGPANLTAASLRSGRVSTVVLQADSKIASSDGARLSWEEALAQMTEGDLIRVKGKRDHTRNTIFARRMTLLGSALAAAAAPIRRRACANGRRRPRWSDPRGIWA